MSDGIFSKVGKSGGDFLFGSKDNGDSLFTSNYDTPGTAEYEQRVRDAPYDYDGTKNISKSEAKVNWGNLIAARGEDTIQRGQQQSVYDMLAERARGNAPSVAQNQLAQATNATMSGARSQAASARGGAMQQASAQRSAMYAGAQSGQQAAGQMATLRAQEQAAAERSLAEQANAQRAQALQRQQMEQNLGLGVANIYQGYSAQKSANDQYAQSRKDKLFGGAMSSAAMGLVALSDVRAKQDIMALSDVNAKQYTEPLAGASLYPQTDAQRAAQQLGNPVTTLGAGGAVAQSAPPSLESAMRASYAGAEPQAQQADYLMPTIYDIAPEDKPRDLQAGIAEAAGPPIAADDTAPPTIAQVAGEPDLTPTAAGGTAGGTGGTGAAGATGTTAASKQGPKMFDWREQMAQQEQQRQDDEESQRQMQGLGSLLGGLGMGGYALATSDANAKTGVQSISDQRSKTAATPASSASSAGSPEIREFLDDLTPYSYEYKPGMGDGPGQRYGVMAQDLKRSDVGSTMVQRDPETGMLAINVAKGVGPMLAAEADMHRRISALESMVAQSKKGRR